MDTSSEKRRAKKFVAKIKFYTNHYQDCLRVLMNIFQKTKNPADASAPAAPVLSGLSLYMVVYSDSSCQELFRGGRQRSSRAGIGRDNNAKHPPEGLYQVLQQIMIFPAFLPFTLLRAFFES